MYVIIGATGNTGSVIAQKLLAKGQKVRVVGRDGKRLEPLSRQGAEAFVADVTDATGIAKAMAGANAVYAMIPPNVSAPDVRSYQDRVSDALAAAIRQNGLSHAVVLSSIGADKMDRTGPVVGLRHLEDKISGIPGLNVLILRAGYFMENLLPQVRVIQMLGNLAGTIRADLPLPWIATRDIAAVAAETLLLSDFQGKRTRELQGPGDISYNEVAERIGRAIGKPRLAYQQLSPEQVKPALTQMGMSASMADSLLEMNEALNSGYMKPLEPRSTANATATVLDTFLAEKFVPAFRGKAAGAS